jgi:branched-chain amino acid transport system substrate-binding protein
MFHIEGANSMYVMAVGQYLLRENMVKGKKWYSLTADYAFGHDLLRVAKKFMEANGGQFAAGSLNLISWCRTSPAIRLRTSLSNTPNTD